MAKPSEPGREHEDRVMHEAAEVRPGQYCLGIADGAGGEGIFAGEWAQMLLDQLRCSSRVFHTARELDQWVEGFYEVFEKKIAGQVGEGSLQKQKFEREGALSTLTALWLRPAAGGGAEFEWMAYGDSCLFLWKAQEGRLQVMPRRMSADVSGFSKATYLISTAEPVRQAGFESGLGSARPGDQLFLATDALSQYLILAQMLYIGQSVAAIETSLQAQAHPLSGSVANFQQQLPDTFSGLIKDFAGMAQNEEKFKDFCQRRYEQGLLVPDDYSLIHLPL